MEIVDLSGYQDSVIIQEFIDRLCSDNSILDIAGCFTELDKKKLLLAILQLPKISTDKQIIEEVEQFLKIAI